MLYCGEVILHCQIYARIIHCGLRSCTENKVNRETNIGTKGWGIHIVLNPFISGVCRWSGNLQHYIANRDIFEKYLRKDCQNQQEKQLPIKYFSNVSQILHWYQNVCQAICIGSWCEWVNNGEMHRKLKSDFFKYEAQNTKGNQFCHNRNTKG